MSATPDTPDLTFATTQELLAELEKRAESCVFMGIMKSEQQQPGVTLPCFWFSGRWHSALGLAYDMIDELKELRVEVNDLAKNGEDDDTDTD